MNTMNEIDIDFLDRLEYIMTLHPRGIGDIKDDFDIEKQYTTLFDSSTTESLNIPETSILNIFVLLGAKPNKDIHYLKTSYRFYDDKYAFTDITDLARFLTQALFSMIEFINLSTYIFNRFVYDMHPDKQNMLLRLLIVVASNMYEELYSSRGKIEFAYYYKKLLQNPTDISIPITKYNRESWRGDFAKYTKSTKDDIDKILHDDDEDMKIINIGNIALISGKMTDEDLLPLEERYFIEAGIIDYETKHYNRIFITNFI